MTWTWITRRHVAVAAGAAPAAPARRRLGVLILSLCLAAPARAQPSASPDPVATIDADTAALNAGQVEAALAFVADDAVYLRPGGRFVGTGEVRGFIAGLVAQRAAIELLGEREAFGNYARWRSRVTLSDPAQPDAAPTVVQNQSQSIVVDGRILFHHAVRAP